MASAQNIVDTKVGSRVRALREAGEFNDERVADHLGISVDEYRDLERGLKRFSASQLRKLSSLMKLNVAAFFNTIGIDGKPDTGGEVDFGRFAK